MIVWDLPQFFNLIYEFLLSKAFYLLIKNSFEENFTSQNHLRLTKIGELMQ